MGDGIIEFHVLCVGLGSTCRWQRLPRNATGKYRKISTSYVSISIEPRLAESKPKTTTHRPHSVTGGKMKTHITTYELRTYEHAIPWKKCDSMENVQRIVSFASLFAVCDRFEWFTKRKCHARSFLFCTYLQRIRMRSHHHPVITYKRCAWKQNTWKFQFIKFFFEDRRRSWRDYGADNTQCFSPLFDFSKYKWWLMLWYPPTTGPPTHTQQQKKTSEVRYTRRSRTFSSCESIIQT